MHASHHVTAVGNGLASTKIRNDVYIHAGEELEGGEFFKTTIATPRLAMRDFCMRKSRRTEIFKFC